jgi:5'-nucleotidase (lipoprotein e(P4) family)
MRSTCRSRVVTLLAAALILVCLSVAPAPATAQSAPAALQPAPVPGTISSAAAALTGNVYLQTSAEYRACCYGIYACAGSRLEEVVEDADPAPARPAVVMDLDETVIDSGSFETFLYENDLEYTDELWALFERDHPDEVGLIPGAKAFIEKAESLGVTVLYLSNRSMANIAGTEQALERLGINATEPPGRLYLRTDMSSSNKSPRREEIVAKYNVLMYLGDNLRDFSEAFKAPAIPPDATRDEYVSAIDDRMQLADDAACHWGVDWFVLPNPVYGEWQKIVGPSPAAVLRPSAMKFAPGGK